MAAVATDTRMQPRAAWGAVLSMALCVAMLIASEFMPVSLLTPMAEGLRATEGQTGQAISVSGLFAVAASLLITTVAGRLNRKWIMVAMTGFMLLSLVLVAIAPNFAVLMVGRALLGICIGGFLSAIGAKPHQLAAFLWGEGTLVIVGGFVFGLLSGVATAWMLVKLLTGVFDPPPEALSIPWLYLGIVLSLVAVSVVAAVLFSRPPVGHDSEYLRDF